MSLLRIRSVFGLFSALVLTTLWVTSLTFLSAQASATALITEAGAEILNPFLVARATGLTQDTYTALEASARAHPSQPLAIPLLKVHVLGREIAGQTYPQVVHLVYARVADEYYTGGAGAVFEIPPDLQQVLPNFALFNPSNISLPVIPGGPTVSQLPPFVQPFFLVIGLTPDTFTQSGHQHLVGLLPWFWLAAAVLGVLAIALNPSGKKLAGLAQGVVHSAWPIVAVLVGLWILSRIYPTTFAPYTGALAVIRGAFLPVYGIALVIGLLGVALTTWLPGLRKPQPQPQQLPANLPAGVAQQLRWAAGLPSAPTIPTTPTTTTAPTTPPVPVAPPVEPPTTAPPQ